MAKFTSSDYLKQYASIAISGFYPKKFVYKGNITSRGGKKKHAFAVDINDDQKRDQKDVYFTKEGGVYVARRLAGKEKFGFAKKDIFSVVSPDREKDTFNPKGTKKFDKFTAQIVAFHKSSFPKARVVAGTLRRDMWKRPDKVVGVDYDANGSFDKFFIPGKISKIGGKYVFDHEAVSWPPKKKQMEDCIDGDSETGVSQRGRKYLRVVHP